MMACARGATTVEAPEDATVEAVRVPDAASTVDEVWADDPPDAEALDFEAVAAAPRPDPPAPASGASCTVKLQIQDAGTFPGHGVSTTGAQQASRKAWEDACRAVLDATGIDCHDPARVRVASISASTRVVMTQDGAEQEFEQAVELVTFREATGSSNAAATHPEACRLAMDDACRAAIGQPCPSAGVRLVEVDGAPTADESWMPAQPDPPDRVTL